MSNELTPIIKWAGGKRRIAKLILEKVEHQNFNTYFEPFLGGAAVLLTFKPAKAVCCDINPELINLYQVVKNDCNSLINLLEQYAFKNNTENAKEFYYYIRSLDRTPHFNELTDVERAARFIYLNKTCYNGLWRVNSKGQNNVPYGRYVNPKILDRESLLKLSDYLNNNDIELFVDDYTSILDKVGKNDLVYFDPPYDVEEGQNGFVNYTLNGFNRENQKQLKELCDQLIIRGATVIVSNSKTNFIMSLYKNNYYAVYDIIDDIKVTRTISAKASSRKQISEVLIVGRAVNYEKNNITTGK